MTKKITIFSILALTLIISGAYQYGDRLKEFISFVTDINEYLSQAVSASKDNKEIIKREDIKFKSKNEDGHSKVNILGTSYTLKKTSDISDVLTIKDAKVIYLYKKDLAFKNGVVNALCFAENEETICLPLVRES